MADDLVVPNVKKIRDLNLPRSPWATSTCCRMTCTFFTIVLQQLITDRMSYMNRLEFWKHSARSSLQAPFLRSFITPFHFLAFWPKEMNFWPLKFVNVKAKQHYTARRSTRASCSSTRGTRNTYEIWSDLKWFWPCIFVNMWK